MIVSLSEVDAIAKKAARGAGFTWGMAEEAARATRWLCERGANGCAALSGLLTIEDRNIARISNIEKGIWRAASGSLCPIGMGACMADQAHNMSVDGWQANDVVYPILVMPFAAEIAVKTGQSVIISGTNFSALTDGFRLSLDGQAPAHCDQLTIRTTGKTVPSSAAFTRATFTGKDWTVLQSLAHRTYAPATEASRLQGAGAGIIDND